MAESGTGKPLPLENRTALVAGGAGGIGEACAGAATFGEDALAAVQAGRVISPDNQ